MNEKIKELELQCWEPTQYGPAWFNSTKFAELIVRKCIERVRNQCIHVRDSTIEGRSNPFFPDLRVRTEREQGIVECGISSVIALEELIQESTGRWYKENILGDED